MAFSAPLSMGACWVHVLVRGFSQAEALMQNRFVNTRPEKISISAEEANLVDNNDNRWLRPE
jgi:hypothetical protein